MGPVASAVAEFVRTVYELAAVELEQDAPVVILYSDPTVPDRTEGVSGRPRGRPVGPAWADSVRAAPVPVRGDSGGHLLHDHPPPGPAAAHPGITGAG